MSQPVLQESSRLGIVTLTRPLSNGGFGEVWEASWRGNADSHKRVAVKTILPKHTENEVYTKMFEDEARVALLFNHPNVCHSYYHGCEEGILFLVMEYIDGMDLRSFWQWHYDKKQPIPLEVCCRIIADVCSGLHYAHTFTHEGKSVGLIHRDIKLANLMLTTHGLVKVVDFGIAKTNIDQREPTQEGAFRGSYGYAAPERIQSMRSDVQGDVFALGVVLWEMITNCRLFAGEPQAQMYNIVHSDYPCPSVHRKDCPKNLCDIVMKAIAKDPKDRYNSCLEFQKDLENLFFPEVTKPPTFKVMKYPTSKVMKYPTSRKLGDHVKQVAASPSKHVPPVDQEVQVAASPSKPIWLRFHPKGFVVGLLLAISVILLFVFFFKPQAPTTSFVNKERPFVTTTSRGPVKTITATPNTVPFPRTPANTIAQPPRLSTLSPRPSRAPFTPPAVPTAPSEPNPSQNVASHPSHDLTTTPSTQQHPSQTRQARQAQTTKAISNVAPQRKGPKSSKTTQAPRIQKTPEDCLYCLQTYTKGEEEGKHINFSPCDKVFINDAWNTCRVRCGRLAAFCRFFPKVKSGSIVGTEARTKSGCKAAFLSWLESGDVSKLPKSDQKNCTNFVDQAFQK